MISEERGAEVLSLLLSGELDLAAPVRLERELDAAKTARPKRLGVDLTGLEFLDSCGLHRSCTRTIARAGAAVNLPSGNDRALFSACLRRPGPPDWVSFDD